MQDCDELVISFLFPPNDSVSGITVYKRIIENNKMVDVLEAKPLQDEDDFNTLINDKIYVDMDCDDDWSECIFKFIHKGMKSIKKNYSTIYSRSWLMANHFLAAEYKFKNNHVYWRAEFSDPLIYDLSNNEKTYKQMIVDDEKYINKINNQIKDLNKDLPLIENNSSAYFIAEYLVYLFSDEIIFTNKNQRKIMLEQFPVDVKDMVMAKSVIKPHPTLPDEYYHLKKSSLKLDDDYINIAYFGNDYYGRRHFEGLFYAMESLNHKFKDKIRLYIYINDKKLIKRLVSDLQVKDNVIIRKPLEYFEFLNATTGFDVLVVNDVSTRDSYKINPYLPSKLSDYLGSSANIWAITESGSTLSEADVKYKSDLYDYTSSARVLAEILEDNAFSDDEYSICDDYYHRRLTFLNELVEKEFRKNQRLKMKLKDNSNKKFKLFKK